MKREFIELTLSEKEAEQIAWELYAIRGTAQSLPGEIDMNFKIRVTETSAFVLKISRPGTSVEYLQFQQEFQGVLPGKKMSLPAPGRQLQLIQLSTAMICSCF